MSIRPQPRCPCGCDATLVRSRLWSPYDVCPKCRSGVTTPTREGSHWRDQVEPSAAQLEFWAGRDRQWSDVVGRGPGRLLDVGCGFGHFVRWAGDHGWDAWGFDPDAWAVRRTEAPERVVSDLAELTPPFDLLTLWDVLEHSTEPVELLRSLKSLVRVNGRILVSSPDFVAMKLRWHLLRRDPQKFHDVIRPDEHAIQFTRAGLRRTLETAGWTRVSFVRPPLSRPRPAVVDGLLRRVPGLRHGLFAVAISA